MQRTARIIPFMLWAVPAVVGVLCCVAGCAGYPGVVIEGTVEDWLGQPLPGVAVTASAEESLRPGLSDPLGRYRLRVSGFPKSVVFMKSGYTRVLLPVPTATGGLWYRMTETPRLWPVPSMEGVYLAERGRFRPLDSALPAHFILHDGSIIPALAVTPSVLLDAPLFVGGPDVFPEPATDRFLIAARMPFQETRLWQLRRESATPADVLSSRKRAGVNKSGSPEDAAAKKQSSDDTFYQTVWVADERVSVSLRPVDAPDNTLYVIVPAAPLPPGVYAVHWGGITGNGALEQRVYLFAVPDPATGAIPEPQKTEQQRQQEEKREQQRQQRRKEMDKATNEGMG